MKLVMTLLVRDEEDVLDAHLRFHLARGVDHVIVTDNLSEDRTPEILEAWAADGQVTVIEEHADDYSQSDWVTRMARSAMVDHGADWVINSDADEFWWPQSGDLKWTLASLPSTVSSVEVPRNDFIPRPLDGRPFYRRMTLRERQSVNDVGNALPGKLCHRAGRDVVVDQGNHKVSGLPHGDRVSSDQITILHFPLRSFEQFRNKIVKGGRAYERNTRLGDHVGSAWRHLYRDHEEGRLEDHYRAKQLSPDRIESGLATGKLVRDDRLARFMNSVIPTPEAAAESLPTLGICIPVWNRGDLLGPCLDSLLAQLDGVRASIFVIDNGSRTTTQRAIADANVHPPHELFRVYLPRNMGIPYAVNIFNGLVSGESDFAGLRAPEFVMVADADAFFENPVRELIALLRSDDSIGLVSGHSSVEHPATDRSIVQLDSTEVVVEDKEVERGLCLVLRREDLDLCCPFPHDLHLNFDWQLAKRHPQSMANREKRVVAVDSVAHLGLYDSTWSDEGVPASAEEIAKVDGLLDGLGLMTRSRRARRRHYLQQRANEGQPSAVGSADDESPPRGRAGTTGDRPSGVMVVGMHRSGTSALAGALREMGCYVGETAQLLGADPANPTGYWERSDILSINQRLLASSKADAYRVGEFDSEALATRSFPNLATIARETADELRSKSPWVVKDPRFCLTLPFWKGWLAPMVVVHVVRDPLEVAASLAERDGLASPYAIALWEKYNVSALELSRGLPRIVVSYPGLLDAPEEELAHLHEELTFLGLDGLRPVPRERAATILDPGLRRQRGYRGSERSHLNLDQVRLLAALRNGREQELSAGFEVSAGALEILRSYAVSIDLEAVKKSIEPTGD